MDEPNEILARRDLLRGEMFPMYDAFRQRGISHDTALNQTVALTVARRPTLSARVLRILLTDYIKAQAECGTLPAWMSA